MLDGISSLKLTTGIWLFLVSFSILDSFETKTIRLTDCFLFQNYPKISDQSFPNDTDFGDYLKLSLIADLIWYFCAEIAVFFTKHYNIAKCCRIGKIQPPHYQVGK